MCLPTIVISLLLINNTEHQTFLSAKASTCEHVGYHYSAKEATNSESGWKEFWVCCKCHESFLEKPDGNFVDQDSSKMVGGVDKNHIAYLPSLSGGENGDYYIVDQFDE